MSGKVLTFVLVRVLQLLLPLTIVMEKTYFLIHPGQNMLRHVGYIPLTLLVSEMYLLVDAEKRITRDDIDTIVACASVVDGRFHTISRIV